MGFLTGGVLPVWHTHWPSIRWLKLEGSITDSVASVLKDELDFWQLCSQKAMGKPFHRLPSGPLSLSLSYLWCPSLLQPLMPMLWGLSYRCEIAYAGVWHGEHYYCYYCILLPNASCFHRKKYVTWPVSQNHGCLYDSPIQEQKITEIVSIQAPTMVRDRVINNNAKEIVIRKIRWGWIFKTGFPFPFSKCSKMIMFVTVLWGANEFFLILQM